MVWYGLVWFKCSEWDIVQDILEPCLTRQQQKQQLEKMKKKLAVDGVSIAPSESPSHHADADIQTDPIPDATPKKVSYGIIGSN